MWEWKKLTLSLSLVCHFARYIHASNVAVIGMVSLTKLPFEVSQIFFYLKRVSFQEYQNHVTDTVYVCMCSIMRGEELREGSTT